MERSASLGVFSVVNSSCCFLQGFLKSERVSRMVQSGGCSANDFREVFKKNIERRVRSLPEINGLSKETVLSSWIAKYDAIYRGDEDMRRQPQRAHLSAVSELILSKEQLYEMFQQILSIRKFEHQLLYNACQVRLHLLKAQSSDFTHLDQKKEAQLLCSSAVVHSTASPPDVCPSG